MFDLVKAVAEKHPERAVQIYRTLLSMKESPYMVLSLITRQFRLILETMLLTQNGLTQEQIAARLELREFAVKEYQRQSKTLPRGRLETGSQRSPASGFGYQIGQGGRGNRGRAFNYEICGVTESFQSRLSFIPFEMYFFRPER